MRVIIKRIRAVVKRIITWLFFYPPTVAFGENANENSTGLSQGTVKYEINVSRNGKHVFATDSHIRNYDKESIRKLVELFKVTFPDCKITVTGFSHRNPVLLEFDEC